MIMCTQRWLQALGSELREDSGTRRNICGNFFFFTSSGFPTVTGFDKKELIIQFQKPVSLCVPLQEK